MEKRNNNVTQGIKVVVAKIGAEVQLEERFIIEKRVIKGTESYGMMCSMEELHIPECIFSQFTQNNRSKDGILIMNNNIEVGCSLAEVLCIQDVVIEVTVLPNRRNDCLSIMGLLREMNVAGLISLTPPLNDGDHLIDQKIRDIALTHSIFAVYDTQNISRHPSKGVMHLFFKIHRIIYMTCVKVYI